jgi:hypothetical protein
MAGDPNPGAVVLLYSGQDESGDTLAAGSTVYGPRYDRWFMSQMYNVGASLNTRSLTVFAAQTSAAAVMFFTEYYGCDFAGDFLQYTNAHPQLQWDVNIPAGFYTIEGNLPMMQSMLVLQTQRRPEFRVSYRDLFLAKWNQFANNNLPKEVILKGSPELTWMAFPRQQQYLSENQIYLYIAQDIEIDFSDYWSNYAASISFWIRLNVSNGAVTSQVQKWSIWIEGGAFTSVIKAILEPNVKLAAISLKTAVDQALASFIPPKVTGIYFLAGRQLAPIKSGDFDVHWQSVKGDVTIVFEF